MQNEINELRNQVRTLKGIACLVCCLYGVFCSIGCSEHQYPLWNPTKIEGDGAVRLQRNQSQASLEAKRPAWDHSELRVGLTKSEVIDLFGEPTSIRSEHGMEIWDYEFHKWEQGFKSTISNLLKFIVLDTGAELRFWNLRNVKSYGVPKLKIKKQSGIPDWPPPGRPPIPPSPRELQRLHLEETDYQSSIANLFTIPEFKKNTWNGEPFNPKKFLPQSSAFRPKHLGNTPIEIIILYGVPHVFDLHWSESSKYDQLSYNEAIEDQDSFSRDPHPFVFLIQYRTNDDVGKTHIG